MQHPWIARVSRLAVVFVAGFSSEARAWENASAAPVVPSVGNGELLSLSALPKDVVLRGKGELQQLVITGQFANGGVRDVTANSTFHVVDDTVARLESQGRFQSHRIGSTTVRVEYQGKSVHVPLVVHPAPNNRIHFTNDIVPIFSKLGCNSGACHGKASGQNGFKLSLLGFEPRVDFEALTRESRGRRVLPSSAEGSLLLTKASGAIPHGGGVRLPTSSRDYQLLVRWIREGTRFGDADSPTVVGIEITPPHRILGRDSSQQILVTAKYSDGSTRDVTADAQYHTNDPELLDVNRSGSVTANELPGEGAVMARYLGHVAVFRATVPLTDSPKEQNQLPKTNYIDEHIARKLEQLGIPPSEICTDGEFLRRVTIDICGTLPSIDEGRSFLVDKDPNKRRKLVDRLLHRPEYASYFAQKWGDILRNRQRGLVGVGGGSGRTLGLHSWIRESLAANKPYDRFVRELLTAKGTMYGKEGHPAVGWFNVLQTPRAMVDDMAQVFLGTRIQCAQCHHHPYEKWSQDDYWGLAGFFGRSKLDKPKQKPPREFNKAQTLVILDEGKLTNRQGKVYTKPRPLGGTELDIPKGDDPRQELAKWVTDANNPFFAKALVNRYWAHFFRWGIVDAPDDMRVTNPPSHPELLDALARDFVESGFDLKHLTRTITTSTAYQLSSTPNDFNERSGRSFARFQPRRLPAEVLLDGIDQITGSPTRYRSKTPITRAIELPDEIVSLSGGYKGNFLEVFGKPQRASACECERVTAASLTQSLYMIGSDEIHRKLKDRNSRAAKLVTDKRSLAEKTDELFLAVFARLPRTEEQKAAIAYLETELELFEKEPSPKKKQILLQQVYEDLIWALINTKEFQFNH